MSAFRDHQDHPVWPQNSKNPFDALTEDRSKSAGQPPAKIMGIPILGGQRWWLGPLLVLTAVIGFGTMFHWFDSAKPIRTLTFVELKALDDDGHPIAGAQVLWAEKVMGTTDAFGEWRKYIKLPVNQEISIKVSKESHLGHLTGGKVLLLTPEMAQSKEPRIKLRIRMLPSGKLKKARALFSPERSENLDHKSAANLPKYRSIEISLKPLAKNISDEALPFYQRVQAQILPALRGEAQNQGLTTATSKDLRLSLSYISHSGRSGLIQVKGSWLVGHNWHHSSYLQNFTQNTEAAAKQILKVLRALVPQTYDVRLQSGRWLVEQPQGLPLFWRPLSHDIVSDGVNIFPMSLSSGRPSAELIVGRDRPCQGQTTLCRMAFSPLGQRPPHSGWSRLRFKMVGRHPGPLQVYVSGLPAINKGQGVWQYWGQPGRRQQLSVIEGSRLIYRNSMISRASGMEIVVFPNDQLASLAP